MPCLAYSLWAKDHMTYMKNKRISITKRTDCPALTDSWTGWRGLTQWQQPAAEESL